MDAQTYIQTTEEKDRKRKGMVGSIVVHALIVVLLIVPFIKFPIPPPGQKGILVSLGTPDSGQGDSRPETQNREVVEPKPAASEETVKEAARQVVQKPKAASKEVITAETPEPVAVKESNKKEIERRRAEEAERQRQEREAEEARKKAEEEARKMAEFEANKKQFSNMLSGSGKGNTDKPGNQGDPTGDPNASALEGISTGSGMVGGGLGDRGVLYEPDVSDKSQKTGKVVVNVCVDTNGDVISAEYTQRGSTTTDSDLKALAVKSARKFRFTESDIEKQCGTITIDFQVR